MRFFTFIIFTFIFCIIVHTQDSKKISEKYFPDFNIDIPTPAFDKKKGFTNYSEMMFFINKWCDKYPTKISYQFIGKSQKEKKIPMVFIGDDNLDNLKVCFMGGLHGNEPASTESMLFLIRNLLEVDSLKSISNSLNIAIIPMANIDGYEKQSRYASNGEDLNRDHTKLSNQETIAIKESINKFSPDVMVDFHEYKPYRVDFVNFGEYGTTSMYDCMFLYSGNLNVCPSIKTVIEKTFLPPAKLKLDENGLKYHNYLSSKHKNNKIYFNLGSVSPRSSATSFALGNTISMLMEIRGVGLNRNSFKRRVYTTYLLAHSFLKTSIDNSEYIQSTLKNCNNFPEEITIKFKREKSNYKLNMIDVYNNDIIDVDIVLNNGLKCENQTTRKRPFYYFIDKDLSIVTDKLKILGLTIDTLKFDELFELESYKIISQKKSSVKFQGFYENIVSTTIVKEQKVLKKGTFVVPMDQRKSNLAVETLEPEMLSGFLRFNVIEPNDIQKIYRYTLNKKL